MGSRGNFNMEDPAEQEKIRRGPHEYIATAGKHGTYAPKRYEHQEYPKMMLKEAQPQMKEFRKVNGVQIPEDIAVANYQAALSEWDRRMQASIVKNAQEEARWKKENAA